MRNEHKHARAHVRSQFVSVNVANHPHVPVLPRREQPKDKQQLFSHHLSLYIHHALPLLITLSSSVSTLSLLRPSPRFIVTALLPWPSSPRSTLSPTSQSRIDSHKASIVISPYLLIHLHSHLSHTLQSFLFHSPSSIIFLSPGISDYSSCTPCMSR